MGDSSVKDNNSVSMFSFGEPESVLATNIADYLGVFRNEYGKYYEPPVSQAGLAKVLRANGHHSSCIFFKRNLVVKLFKPSAALSRKDFYKAATDLGTFGNCYLQRIRNGVGQIMRYQHIKAINMRKLTDEEDRFAMLLKNGELLKYKPGEILHICEYDVEQDIYGVPEYLGGLQSLLLNEDATLFRRKYYKNGAHMGYIFYTNDPSMSPENEKAMREQIKDSKGVGNFRSLFVNIPNGTKEAVQIIPVGDISQKDEFERIKNISRNDIISAHRMRPELAGIMPETNGSTGDIEKINRVHIANEIAPHAMLFLQINDEIATRLHIGFDLDEND